jgi:hypothetical protein
MTRLAEHVSAVTPLRETIDGTRRPKPRRERKASQPAPEATTSYICDWCGHIERDESEYRRHLAREGSRIKREALQRIAAGEDLAEVLSDLLSRRGLGRRPRRRLPGEGCVFRYAMVDGTIRWGYKYGRNGKMTLRRVGPGGERWTTHADAERALHEARKTKA